MLSLKLIVFALFILSNGVLCRDRRGSIRHTQLVDDYKFNHPPAPEGYDAIPVAVVYEDDSNREGKAIENDETPNNNIKEVSKDPFKSKTGLMEESSRDNVTKDDQFVTNPTSIEEKGLKVTTYRPQLQKERRIPVTVVYEPEPINYQKSRPNSNIVSNKRKESQQPATEEQFTDKEININLNAPVNGHTGAYYPLSTNTQRNVNTRQKLTRPVPKERTSVNHEISSSVTPAKTEEQNKPKPAAEETTIPNINKRRRLNRPVPKERTNDTSSSVTPGKAVGENIQKTEGDEITIPNRRRKPTRPTTEESSSAAPGKTEEQNKKQSIQKSVAEEATIPNTNKTEEVTKPTRNAHTKVDDNNSPSDIAQRETEEQNKKKNIQKPVVEETTILNMNKREDFVRPLPEEPSIGKIYKLTSVISVKKEDQNNEEDIQKPAAEETTVPNDDKITSSVLKENALSIPTEKKQEDLHTRQKTNTFRAEQKKETLKSNVLPSVQEHKNTPSVTKGNKSGEFQYSANSEQYQKRDNTSRVREVIPIIQSENLVFSHAGNFKYSYEAGDGTKAFESGELKTFDDETAGEAVRGGFSYTAKDGNEYSLSYTADENGYRPVGAHLPTPPPIPPAIARALAYLATKTTPEPITESIAEHFNDQ